MQVECRTSVYTYRSRKSVISGLWLSITGCVIEMHPREYRSDEQETGFFATLVNDSLSDEIDEYLKLSVYLKPF